MARKREFSEALTGALAQLEQNAEQPVVPGDEKQWVEQVVRAIDATERAWRQRHAEHEAVFADILEQDLELAARVEALQTSDRALHQELPQLRTTAASSPTGNGAAPPEAEPSLSAVRARALDWVSRCRTFEQELRTWFTEAYYRDRGPVD